MVSGVGTKGWYYKVSVAGNTTVDSNSSWEVNDVIIFDGTVWDRISGGGDNLVTSVNGMQGDVTIVTITGNAGTSTKWASSITTNFVGSV